MGPAHAKRENEADGIHGVDDGGPFSKEGEQALGLRWVAGGQFAVGEHEATQHKEPRHPREAPREDVDAGNLATLVQVAQNDVYAREQPRPIQTREDLCTAGPATGGGGRGLARPGGPRGDDRGDDLTGGATHCGEAGVTRGGLRRRLARRSACGI